MDDVLNQLVRTAKREHAVAIQELTNGMQILAYPLHEGVLVAVGYCTGVTGGSDAIEVLRRRSDEIPRYTGWLPAMFADGSLHVVRRLTEFDLDTDTPLLTTDELMSAVELLA